MAAQKYPANAAQHGPPWHGAPARSARAVWQSVVSVQPGACMPGRDVLASSTPAAMSSRRKR